MPGEKIARGARTGWCNTCGGDTFNFIRHRCPDRLQAKALNAIIAGKLWRDARRKVRASTVGTWMHAAAEKAEREAADHLIAALDVVDEGNTNGEES